MKFLIKSGGYCNIISSRKEKFFKKDALKNFAKILRKAPVLDCLFNKVGLETLSPAALLKGGSSTVVFL